MTATSERLNVAARGDREIVMTRTFNAPRRLVFDAWTKPELVARWFGRHGWTTLCEIDLRPGGRYRYVMRGPDDAEVVMQGMYREVVPPERLVSTESFDGFTEVGWRPEDETVTTMLLEEHDGRTSWKQTTVYPSKEIRDEALNLAPAWTGMGESMDRLAELLATIED